VPLEISDNPGGVGTPSGGKNREFIHRAQNYGRPNEPGLNSRFRADDITMTEGQRDLSQIAETHAQ
jgi:hypothetical protein